MIEIHIAPKEALHRILQEAIGAPPIIATYSQGKPYVQNAPDLKFSCSRTRGKSLIAITANFEIGVDVERIRPMPDLQPIAELFLPPGNAEALADTPAADREREFFRLWTRAEAAWKAAGLGLYGAGRAIEGEWHVEDLDLGPDYAAAVAIAGGAQRITILDSGTQS